jgi:hypothetical protein
MLAIKRKRTEATPSVATKHTPDERTLRHKSQLVPNNTHFLTPYTNPEHLRVGDPHKTSVSNTSNITFGENGRAACVQVGKKNTSLGRISFVDRPGDPNCISTKTTITVAINDTKEADRVRTMNNHIVTVVKAQTDKLFGKKVTSEMVTNKLTTSILTEGKPKADTGEFWPPNIKTTVQFKKDTPDEMYDCTIKDTTGAIVELSELRGRTVNRMVFSIKVYATKRGEWGVCKYLRILEVQPAENISTSFQDETQDDIQEDIQDDIQEDI